MEKPIESSLNFSGGKFSRLRRSAKSKKYKALDSSVDRKNSILSCSYPVDISSRNYDEKSKV